MTDQPTFPDDKVYPFRGAGPSTWFEECRAEPEEWLIERLVPRRSYTGIFGRRGAAKSFLALEMACRGAAGQPFLGEPSEKFGSIYCVGEKKSRFAKRIEAWRISRGVDRLPVLFRWAVPNLLDPGEVAGFIAELQAAKVDFRARGVPLGAVFLDTLSRAIQGANVSDADAAGQALNSIQQIIDQAEVTVIPLAHVAKAIEGRMVQKGAGEWEDAADALIRIDREDGEPLRTVTLSKQSDEADGLAYAFELEVVDVGQTPKGQRVTSCVIRLADLPDSGTKRLSRQLKAPAMLVLAAIDRIEEAGQTEPVPFVPGAKAGTLGVRVAQLRERSYDLGLQKASEPTADAEEKAQKQWFEARRKAFQRALDDLVQARRVRHEGDFVWRL